MNDLIEFLEKKKESTLNDYNRFMEKPNEYKEEALLCRGQYLAYTDLIYHIKTHKEEYGCKNS